MIRLPAPSAFELWQIDLSAEPGGERLGWLSRAEEERAARFVFERDRRRYRAAHCGLRQLLGARAGRPPEQLVFHEGRFGKPALTGEPRCAFNLSHSEDVALMAMADDGDIGVDVELLRPMCDVMPLAEQNFSASECAQLAGKAAPDRPLAFLLGWTRKEACLKAIGSGLSIAPRGFTVGLVPEPSQVSVATPEGPAIVWVRSFLFGPRMIASLARVESSAG